MKPFVLTIERHRIDHARVTVYAEGREEAERLGYAKANSDEVLWEDSTNDISVEAERRR